MAAQDRVTVKDPRTGKNTQFDALVLDWDAERLLYKGNDRERTMPSSRVVDVAYPRTPKHLEADQQREMGQFLQAWQSYKNALSEEPRGWVKVELLAGQLKCALALNRQRDALAAFFAIQQATPKSRYFHLLPLPWYQTRVDGAMVSTYRDWLSEQNEIRRLIAASWLLKSDEAVALQTLKTLAQSDDARIAHLATAQAWRSQMVATTTAELLRWQAALRRMPTNFQAGPRFLIALAKRRANRQGTAEEFNQALVSMLQVPILFPEDYQIAGAALLEAHEMLVTAGRDQEASIVLAELKRDYALSNAALSLSSRIENMDQ
ncbi:MAG: hypothetical protein P8J33_04430 [Pirellulaceae bacterium]|nr:hypothetical protein [Pirellulaceae bacterium]